ncbi:MAG: bifunctional riboflavin kinase/FAD synthetase [Phycisphaerae bacterium]
MRIILGLENLKRPDRPVALTIGNFDGMHLGHQSIVRKVVELAKSNNLMPVVVTFEFHPLKFLTPQKTPGLLMSLEEREKIMSEMGIELVVVARCNDALLKMERDEFIGNILMRYFDVNFIVEGPNFRFGHDRTGDIDYLIRTAQEFGFHAIKIDPVQVNLGNLGVQTLSSSLVRKLISSGKVDLARNCLGRPYQLIGEVIAGVRRGRSIGFPTANLDVGEQLLPQHGIYAARVQMGDSLYPAAAVIGPAPTFEQYETAVEAYLIGYNGDLYGRKVILNLYRGIRDIIKFQDAPQLVEQIKHDVKSVLEILKQEEAT